MPYESRSYAENMNHRYSNNNPSKKNWLVYVLMASFILFLFYIFINDYSKDLEEIESIESLSSDSITTEKQEEIVEPVNIQRTIKNYKSVSSPPMSSIVLEEDDVRTVKSTIEILQERNHANVMKEAARVGVSTEGTTVEILERINHANVVKEATRAGVSTEGSTIEILERINQKTLENYLK